MRGGDVTTSVSHAEVIRQQIAAINAHDPAGLAIRYGADAVVLDPQYAEPLRGREAIERDTADFVTAFPDLRAQVTRTLFDGATHALEMTVSGTNTGPLTLPTGSTVPPTNRRAEIHMAVFGRVDGDGLVVEERRYFDIAGLLAQLGLAE